MEKTHHYDVVSKDGTRSLSTRSSTQEPQEGSPVPYEYLSVSCGHIDNETAKNLGIKREEGKRFVLYDRKTGRKLLESDHGAYMSVEMHKRLLQEAESLRVSGKLEPKDITRLLEEAKDKKYNLNGGVFVLTTDNPQHPLYCSKPIIQINTFIPESQKSTPTAYDTSVEKRKRKKA